MKISWRNRPYTIGLLLMLVVVVMVLAVGIGGSNSIMDLLAGLDQRVHQNYLAALAIFTVSFIILATLGLPIGSLYCLTAGYLFGTLMGAGASLLASVAAAMLTLLIARGLIGPSVRKRIAEGRLSRLIALLERDAIWYLILLRIVPIAPFFLVNFAAGVTRIDARSFFLATLAGMAPTALIYASLGSGIGSLIEARELTGARLLLRADIALPLSALALLVLFSWRVKHRLALRAQSNAPGSRNTTRS